MHARNRNPGNGYRSNSMVMGASRVSPESSMRGQAAYRSDYRSFNHGGYGRGQPRQVQRPPQQKQGDVFMEAGRLATEYLVSKGVMPPDVLTGKWKSDSFQNQAGADVMQLPSGGRTPALSRLGGPVTDVGPGRRRYPDEYYSTSSNNVRDRRSGSFKNPSPDRSREFGRSGSLTNRSRASVVADGDNDASSTHQGQQKVSNEGGSVSQDHTPESAPAKDNGGTVESTLEKPDLIDNASAEASSCSREKDISVVGDVELLQEADVTDPQPEAGEIRDENDYDVTEQGQAKDDKAIEEGGTVDNVLNETDCDLVKLSSSDKVSGKTCSAITFQGLKVDADDMTINADTLQDEPPKESGSCVKDMDVGLLPGNDSSILQSENLELPSKEDELLISHNNSHHTSNALVSEVDKSLSEERVTNEELPECVIVNSTERGEKRAMTEESTKENKRPRESGNSENCQSEGRLLLLDSLEKQPTREESIVLDDGVVLLPSDEQRLPDISLFPKDDTESSMDYTEEKQLFPGSFKTCDLNLMEASDMNENHEKKNIILFPSATERGKQPIPVNIDLSMSNSSLVSSNFGECSIAGKDIEVIDLENEPEQEEKGLNNSEKRSENVFTCLDGYTNNTQNGNDISDVQDGYGLMISELLGNDMPSCSSVPTDLNSLHSDMNLHSSENMLGDDDSIYMSLEEIPISFMRVWEQPSQDYGKPF